VFDVAVDIRPGSATFGRWVGVELSANNKRKLWIPTGLAHGFVTLSEHAEFLYKTTDYWYPEHERTLLWSDPALGIAWPIAGEPIVAAKDAAGVPLAAADVYPCLLHDAPLPDSRVVQSDGHYRAGGDPGWLRLLRGRLGQLRRGREVGPAGR